MCTPYLWVAHSHQHLVYLTLRERRGISRLYSSKPPPGAHPKDQRPPLPRRSPQTIFHTTWISLNFFCLYKVNFSPWFAIKFLSRSSNNTLMTWIILPLGQHPASWWCLEQFARSKVISFSLITLFLSGAFSSAPYLLDSLWETRNLRAILIETSAGCASERSETSTTTSLNCPPVHWHLAKTGNSSSLLFCDSSVNSNMLCNWNFYPPSNSETHQSTTRFVSFHTPPGGLHIRLSPRNPSGTLMMIVRLTKPDGFCGFELIWRATLQNFPWVFTRIWTRWGCRNWTWNRQLSSIVS